MFWKTIYREICFQQIIKCKSHLQTEQCTMTTCCKFFGNKIFICTHVVILLLNRVWFFATPQTILCQASPSFTTSWSLLKLMSVELMTPSNHFILCCHPLLLSSIFPSIKVPFNESALHIRWSKYWSFRFSISPSQWILRGDCLQDW